jgi:hypothetical protein
VLPLSDTHIKHITSLTAVLLPFVTYLLILLINRRNHSDDTCTSDNVSQIASLAIGILDHLRKYINTLHRQEA